MVRPQIIALIHFWWIRRHRGFLAADWAKLTVWLVTAILVATFFPAVILVMSWLREWLISSIPEHLALVDLTWSVTLAISFFCTAGVAYIRAVSEFGRAEPNIAVGWPWHSATQLSARLARSVARSLWPMFVLGWPLLIAATWPNISGAYLAYTFLAAVVLGLAAVSWGIALGLLSLRMEWRISPLLGRIVAMGIFGLALILLVRSALSGVDSVLTNSFSSWHLRPFDLLAATTLSSSVGPAIVPAIPMTIIFGLVTVGIGAVYFFGRFGHRYWLRVEEPAPRPVHHTGFRPWPKFFAPRHVFLFEKERLSLVRDVGAIGKLTAIVLLIIAILLLGVQAQTVIKVNEIVALANLSAGLMISLGVCTVIAGLNFCFPALSLEGRETWLLRATPLHLHELYSWKFFFWSLLLGAINFPAAIFIAYWLKLPSLLIVLFAAVAIIMTLAIISLTLGQGFLFPHWAKPRSMPLAIRHPEWLAESSAGLISLAMSAVYLMIVYHYLRRFVGWYLVTGETDGLSLLGFAVVSVSIVIFYWIMAPLKLEQEERCC